MALDPDRILSQPARFRTIDNVIRNKDYDGIFTRRNLDQKSPRDELFCPPNSLTSRSERRCPRDSQRTDNDCMCRMNPYRTLAQLLGSFLVITFIARCLAADVGATRARYKFLRYEENFSPIQPKRSICGTGSNTSRLETLDLCPSAGKSGNASRVTRTNSSARTPAPTAPTSCNVTFSTSITIRRDGCAFDLNSTLPQGAEARVRPQFFPASRTFFATLRGFFFWKE